MTSTENWWNGAIDWTTPAGLLLCRFVASLPRDRAFHITLYGSAALQLTVDRILLSGDVDLFADDDQDLSLWIERAKMDRCHGGLYIEPGYELSFRTSPRWRQRAKSFEFDQVTLTIPHPIDILIGKLARLEPKDLEAFRRTLELTGHPTPDEMVRELQIAVDLFRPEFDESSPNGYPENTRRLWRDIFHQDIDVRQQIIEPAIAKRKVGFGEIPPDYKAALNRKNPPP